MEDNSTHFVEQEGLLNVGYSLQRSEILIDQNTLYLELCHADNFVSVLKSLTPL
jgi:hypothetical protein